MEDEKAMRESVLQDPTKHGMKRHTVKRCTAFVLTGAVFVCVFMCAFVCDLFTFTAEVYANGNTSADDPVPQPQIKKSVRKAPIKRSAKRPVKKRAKKTVIVKKAPPTSLETGIALMEKERYEQARPWLQKAVQEERRNPYAWYWYGMAHEKIGQFQQAQFFYARTLALDPAFPPFVRVTTYPEGDRKPLWDPLRPPRVYPVETETRGVTGVPPSAPEATVRPPRPPVDPEIPKVPMYVPPEPPVIPGDALQPPVYVPPSHPEQVPPQVPILQETFVPPVPPVMEQAPMYVPPPPQVNTAATKQAPVYMPPVPQATPASPDQQAIPVPPVTAPAYTPANN
jgi:hypothetical protein